MRVVEFNNKKFRFETRDEADQSVLNEIFKFREYRAADEAIKNARVIIDAGAHAGFFAHYCRALNVLARIYCLEPEPDNVKQLEKHLALNNLENVFVFPVALADRNVAAKLYLSVDSHNHSLSEIKNVKSIPVRTFSLSGFSAKNNIKIIDLLKMDIEGGEATVIADIDNWPPVKTVLFEYHGATRKLAEKFIERGYAVQIFPSQFDKKFGIVLARKK